MPLGDCRRDRHPGIFLIFYANLLHSNQIFLIFAASISFIKNKKKEKIKKQIMKILFFASLLLALPLQAQNNTPCDAISGVLDKVQNEYVAEGNFNKALKTLNKTIKRAQNSDCPQLQDAINLFGKIEKITSSEAFREYGKKLAKGNAAAQKAIGDCYFNAKKGLPLDIVESTKWYMKAADQGDPGAQYQLAWCYEHAYVGEEQNYDEAGKLYMKAAEQGYALAENQVGHYFQSGLYGERDYEEAVKWFRKAADNDLAEAQKNLGWCYCTGRGVEKDLAEGVRWYMIAAEQGNAEAQYYLAECYQNGFGVAKDISKAIEWHEKAAAQHYQLSVNELKKIREKASK